MSKIKTQVLILACHTYKAVYLKQHSQILNYIQLASLMQSGQTVLSLVETCFQVRKLQKQQAGLFEIEIHLLKRNTQKL